MTRSLDNDDEGRLERLHIRAGRAAMYGLESGVQRAGGELTGLSAKFRGGDVLLTLKILMPAGPMVAFVGGDTLASCLAKAEKQAQGDELKLRVDQWG